MHVNYMHTYGMITTPSSIAKWQPQFAALWPALKGSLNQVRKPCIRKHCPACARGDKHPAWLLTFTQRGRRHCLHVPLELVPTLQQAVRNGKQLEALLYEVGPAWVKEYRQNRQKTAPKPAKPKRKS
jgi:hypothetical protein